MTDAIYRQPTDPPTEPGWYYARQKKLTRNNIEPVLVDDFLGFRLCAFVRMDGRPSDLRFFDWFGPVPEVREG